MDRTPNLRNHPYILLSPYLGRALHALDTDGSVHVWGEAAFCPFHFTLKLPDVDNTS